MLALEFTLQVSLAFLVFSLELWGGRSDSMAGLSVILEVSSQIGRDGSQCLRVSWEDIPMFPVSFRQKKEKSASSFVNVVSWLEIIMKSISYYEGDFQGIRTMGFKPLLL